jgi:hypothetical protein
VSFSGSDTTIALGPLKDREEPSTVDTEVGATTVGVWSPVMVTATIELSDKCEDESVTLTEIVSCP